MKPKIFLAFVQLLIFSGCAEKGTSDIEKAEWIIGTWENVTPKGSIYETWSIVYADEYEGKSYMLKEKDTVVFETVSMVQKEGGLFYIPAVKNQNEGLPVRFTLKSISETRFVFENPEHDFPQVISYVQIGNDSLVAEISGIADGEERKVGFPMKRMN